MFAPNRGLRHGDHPSLHLFVICMEKLSHIIMSVVEDGNWKPLKLSRNGHSLSHLFFGDDLLLFSKVTASQTKLVTNTFKNFAQASGLCVNFSKSRAFFSNSVPRSKKEKISAITRIRGMTSFDKYIGFPMLQGRVTTADFEFIVEKI